MIKDLFLKINIKSYVRKLNNKMLYDTYIHLSKKNPKTHIDNIYCMCLIQEINRRGGAHGVPKR